MSTAEQSSIDPVADYVAGLRELADFYEANPTMPLPYHGTHAPLNIWSLGDEPREALAAIARMMGRAEKSTDEHFFKVARSFGPIRLEAGAYHEEVCERVVTGVDVDEYDEYDEAAYEAAVADVPKVTRRVEREVVEWQCPESILRPVGS